MAGVNIVDALVGNKLAGLLFDVAFSVGAEAGNAIRTTVTLKYASGKPLANKHAVQLWLSDTVAGAVSGVAPSGAVAIGTAGVIIASHTAKTHLEVVSDATGVFDLDVTEAGAKSYYINVAIGGQVFSQIITFV